MSLRVLADKEEGIGVLYDGTSGKTYGTVFRCDGNPRKELTEFIDYVRENNQSGQTIKEMDSRTRTNLFTAFKVEKGVSDRADWQTQVSRAEDVFDREIVQGRLG